MRVGAVLRENALREWSLLSVAMGGGLPSSNPPPARQRHALSHHRCSHLHVHRHQGHSLASIEEYKRPLGVGDLDDVVDWVDAAQHVGHVQRRHQFCLRAGSTT